MYPVTREHQVKFRPEWDWRDFLLLLCLLALLLGIIRTAAKFGGAYDVNLPIETSLNVLPAYTAQTLLRMVVAYFLSLVFTLVYAYTAYRYKPASLILISLLYILQSIPVLSFLPGVILALIALFWGQRIGVELAAILLIFTGITWNMTFSFYQSLCSIPRELFETVETENVRQSVVLDFLRRSPTLRVFKSRVWKPLGQGFNQGIVHRLPYPTSATRPRQRSVVVQWLNWFFLSGVTFIVLWGTWEAVMLLGMLDWAEWQQVIIGAILTALRVFTALVLSLAWTVPVGVAIGRNPRLAQILQPLVQIAAWSPSHRFVSRVASCSHASGRGLTNWFYHPDDVRNNVVFTI